MRGRLPVYRLPLSHLKLGGRLVIVDGFRLATFVGPSKTQRAAVALTEFGSRMNVMVSKAECIREGRRSGLRFIRDQDQTDPRMAIGPGVASVPHPVAMVHTVHCQKDADGEQNPRSGHGGPRHA